MRAAGVRNRTPLATIKAVWLGLAVADSRTTAGKAVTLNRNTWVRAAEPMEDRVSRMPRKVVILARVWLDCFFFVVEIEISSMPCTA